LIFNTMSFIRYEITKSKDNFKSSSTICRHFWKKILWMMLIFTLFDVMSIIMSFIMQKLIKWVFLRLTCNLIFSTEFDCDIIESNTRFCEEDVVEEKSWFSMIFLRRSRLKHRWMRYLVVLLIKLTNLLSK
jgi:hypothetical protein